MDLGGVHVRLARIPRKCITVHPNGDFSQGRVLYVQTDWDMDALLNAASQRLEMVPSARRLFNADGMEIEDVLQIEDGTFVFVSSGADFIPIRFGFEGEESDGEGSHRNGGARRSSGDASKPLSPNRGSSGIPASVGGYVVGELLGRGGFGEVRLGQHQLTHEKVALKFLPKSSIVASMGAAERATTEIQCLMALNHPNVIRLVQQYETPKYMVMVFELMEGGDLHHYLASLPAGCLSEDEARTVFHQIVGAVSYAHNHHICHRDLKLDNVLLSKEGNTTVFKIADFGLSDFYPPGATRRSQCGSLSYLAPEVFRGTSNAGPPIDVWALGVILFALLSGRLPFEAGQIKAGKGGNKKNSNLDEETIIRNRIIKGQYKMDDSLSPEAKDLIRRMLKLDPTERATMPEVITHCWLRMRHGAMFDLQHQRLTAPDAAEAREEKALLMGVGGVKILLSPRTSLTGGLPGKGGSKQSSPTSMTALPPSFSPPASRAEAPRSARGLVPPLEASGSEPASVGRLNGSSPPPHDGDGHGAKSFRGISPSPKYTSRDPGGAAASSAIPIISLDAPLLTSSSHVYRNTNSTSNPSLAFNIDLPALERENSGDASMADDKGVRRSPANWSPPSARGGSSSYRAPMRAATENLLSAETPTSPNAALATSPPNSTIISRGSTGGSKPQGSRSGAHGAGSLGPRFPRTGSNSSLIPSLRIPNHVGSPDGEAEDRSPSTSRSVGLPAVTSSRSPPRDSTHSQDRDREHEPEATTPGGSSSSIPVIKQAHPHRAAANSPANLSQRGSRRGREDVS